MYEQTKSGLEEAQDQAMQASRRIRETNRSALRSYLRAAFQLQRAGIDTLEALQHGAEELTFTLVDRAEEAQEKAAREAESRLRESADRLRQARERSGEALRENNERLRENAERLQARFRREQDELEEGGDRVEGRLRDGAEIALKVVKVVETRVETMLTELLELGRRELSEVEERIEAIVDRLDAELEEEIHPISNYEEKTVEEVVAGLSGLDEMQLRTVRAFETRHKNRVTVLRAIDEKLAELDELLPAAESSVAQRGEAPVTGYDNPIADYDSKNADEVVAALAELDRSHLGAVRRYELQNKNRVTVLRAIDEKLHA